MADKNKTIYYSDELNDDFASLGIKKKPLGDDFEYIHKNILWNTCSFVIYRMIAQPLVFVFVKVAHRQRFKNRKVLKTARKTGAFIYANHTNMLLDAFVPNIVKLRKRGYILVGPDTTSIPGLKNIVEMVGAIPLGQTLSENKEMLECINHRIAKNKGFITIYPEAHIWPYYTGIRDFKAGSFSYPCYTDTPVFAMTNCYQKKLIGKHPKVVTFVDGPFYPDKNLPMKERKEKLRKQCYDTMVKRAKENSTYSYIVYEKKDLENAAEH
ncbi:MAG: 1-acyl-sn-glycerol-3-phosphate acyltransferase [Spirochaetales bacterium]|jgi:1-acyl-sn-glycerol-3-phosphate acyltransferase|nr:1-acyl-sn-glycerol-3-phosphate acyltransferase [Spirochaetales bacterium]